MCGANCFGAIKRGYRLQKVTYDHTHWRTRDPVRSPIDKSVRARLVVGSLTTSEPLVLYVFLHLTRFVELIPFCWCVEELCCLSGTLACQLQ